MSRELGRYVRKRVRFAVLAARIRQRLDDRLGRRSFLTVLGFYLSGDGSATASTWPCAGKRRAPRILASTDGQPYMRERIAVACSRCSLAAV